MNQRKQVLEQVAEAIVRRAGSRATIVAVDGVDAAGKSSFARDLRPYVGRLGRDAICVSLDGFHKPRAARYEKGALSPEGYYEDAFDYPRLVNEFLAPVRAARVSTLVTAAVFDVAADAPVSDRVVRIDPCSIVLFDGVFLLRQELQLFWDFTIFLQIRPETSLARGVARDAAAMGGEANARERYLARYLPAQQCYLASANPAGRADTVIDNEDFDAPQLIKASSTS
jgi:uridine kinase